MRGQATSPYNHLLVVHLLLAFPNRSSYPWKKIKTNEENKLLRLRPPFPTKNDYSQSISTSQMSAAAEEEEEESFSSQANTNHHLLRQENELANQIRDFPESISPGYQPLPFILRAFIVGASAFIAAIMEADGAGKLHVLPKSLFKFISRVSHGYTHYKIEH